MALPKFWTPIRTVFPFATVLRSIADRWTVYAAAVDNIGAWWNSDHTISGDAANLYMTTDMPGCFCESLGDSGGLVHMTVSFVNPGVMLRLSGGLGTARIDGRFRQHDMGV